MINDNIGVHYGPTPKYSCKSCTRKCEDRSGFCFKYSSLFSTGVDVFNIDHNAEEACYYGVVVI